MASWSLQSFQPQQVENLQKSNINLFWWHIFADFVPLAHPQIFKNRYSRSYFWKIFGDFCLMQHMTPILQNPVIPHFAGEREDSRGELSSY